jgi:hypothetical protein
MNAQINVIQILVVAAALGHFITVPALVIAPRLGMLGLDDFRKLAPINYRIVLVVMGTIQMVLLASGATVIWARADLVSGSRLSIATTGSLALLWIWRLGVQILAYGPLFTRTVTRWLHLGLIILFAFMGCAYAMAFAHGVQVATGR